MGASQQIKQSKRATLVPVEPAFVKSAGLRAEELVSRARASFFCSRACQTPDSDALLRLYLERFLLAYDFYRSNRRSWDTEESILAQVDCIDFSESVELMHLPYGTPLTQYQAAWGKQGSYFSTFGFGPEHLGVAPIGHLTHSQSEQNKHPSFIVQKSLRRFYVVASEGVTVLQSTATPAIDSWSIRNESFMVPGGGLQFYYPGCQSSIKPTLMISRDDIEQLENRHSIAMPCA